MGYEVLVVDRGDRERVLATYHFTTAVAALHGRIDAMRQWVLVGRRRVLVSAPRKVQSIGQC